MKRYKIDKINILISLVIVALISGYIVISPESGTKTMTGIRDVINNNLGLSFLWIGFIAVIFLLWLSFSKYGNIRLGEGKPAFSTFSWAAMMFCAGMGSSLQYWSAIEWAYYYSSPPLGAEPFSAHAAELSISYGFFHWSISAWALYCIGAIPLAYSFYVKKRPQLKLSAICEGVLGKKTYGPIGKAIDILFMFGVIGGLSTTLGLGVPMISNSLSKILPIADSFGLQVGIVLFISLIFTISSYVGLESGMKKISDLNSYFAIIFVAFVLIAGPTLFILKSTTNGLSILFSDFIKMSLWTDPVNQSGFPEGWTMFYWAWWLALGPWMWLFTAKISKGRRIKDIIWGMITAGSLGCWVYFGVISNYGLHSQLTDKIDIVGILNQSGGAEAVSSLISSLPLGSVALVAWALIAVLFLATTLDSASYTLAAGATVDLQENDNPGKLHRLFWALVLASLPLVLMFAGAPLQALQTSSTVTGLPILIVLLMGIYSTLKWLKEDYGKMNAFEIIKHEEAKFLQDPDESIAEPQ